MEKEAIYRYLSVEEILKRVLRIIKAEEAEGNGSYLRLMQLFPQSAGRVRPDWQKASA